MADSPRPARDAAPLDATDRAPAEAAEGAGAPALSAELETREQYLLREEEAVGGTDLARGINDGLRALARAARSFLLYDPGNEAIRVFLDQYRREMLEAVQAVTHAGHPEGVDLVVRPFELAWLGEVVYLERDRERSLAFRMFRDGVRRLTLGPAVTWDELLRLLQILSIRFTGVRQQEEDIVTLLWKAGFQGIEIVAVEGFVPEDDARDDGVMDALEVAGQGEERARTGRARARRAGGEAASQEHVNASFVDAPPDFDLPIPPSLEPGRLLPMEIPQEALEELRHEAGSLSLPDHCVRLVTEMFRLVADPTDPTDWSDVAHLADEVRDFLLSEGQLEPLLALVRALEDLRAVDPRRFDGVTSGFVDARALRRIIRSIPAAHTRPPPELLWLLDHLPGDHLATCLEVLATERGTSARRIVRQLVERFVTERPEVVLGRMRLEDPAVAADLLRAFCEAVPSRALEAVGIAVERGDADLAFEGLRVLERQDVGPALSQALLGLLESGLEEVRLRVLEQVAGRHMQALYPQVLEILLRRTRGDMTPAEATAFGTTLVVLDPQRAATQLTEWIRPKGLLKRFFHDPIGHRWLQWAAVSGLALVPGEEPEKVIRWLAERAGSELADHCSRTLARRRREQHHG
ncbi:hypothetical protein L6R53_05905 [Myxococcota bacterium]|nr:hypothetical protein [Myxococcota bacterium]